MNCQLLLNIFLANYTLVHFNGKTQRMRIFRQDRLQCDHNSYLRGWAFQQSEGEKLRNSPSGINHGVATKLILYTSYGNKNLRSNTKGPLFFIPFWVLKECPISTFRPMLYFYTPWKPKNASGFLAFSGGIES